MFRRHRRWVSIGVFDATLETFRRGGRMDTSPDTIDSTVVRAHHCAIGLKGDQDAQGLGRSRAGSTTKLHARCDGQGRPLYFVLTPRQAHDVQGFRPLFRMLAERIDALLAEKGYGTNAIGDTLAKADVEAVISAKRNRRTLIPHARGKYRSRNLVERLFSKLKN